MATKVGEIRISNFKKIKALEVRANGGNVFIMGKNGTGKTTLIQALYCILTGKELPPDPITIGEHKGAITVELLNDSTRKIECVATLSFTEKNPKGKLTVTTEDGRDVPGGPRMFLDKLCGDLLFDPFDFIRKTPKEQVKEFKRMFGFNFDALDKEHKEIWDKRADVNKDIKNLKGVIETSDIKEHELKLFVEKKDLVEITKKLQSVEKDNKEYNQLKSEVERINKAMNETNLNIQNGEGKCKEIQKVLTEYKGVEFGNLSSYAGILGENDADGKSIIEAINKLTNAHTSLAARFDTGTDYVVKALKFKEELLKHLEDANELLKGKSEKSLTEINKEYTDAVMFNQKCDKVAEHRNKLIDLEEKEMLSKQYSERLKEINEDKMRVIAEKNIRVPGLTFDVENECLMYEGLAFDETQISKSRIIAVGVELMMATNPELRICRIKDGSLLDNETLDELIKVINEQDFQAFVELVSPDKEGLEVTIQEV